jgi:hypothetical protein
MGGFHMGFGGSTGAAAQVLDAIRSQAEQGQWQQQAQQQQMLKDQFEQELKLREKGYTPFMQATGQEASGLKRRDAQQVDPSRVIQDPYGRKWVAPGPDAPATPQQTFTDTRELLDKGARPVDASGNVLQDQQIPRYRQDAFTDPVNGSQVLNPTLTDTGRFGINAAPPEGTTVTPPGSKQAYFMPGEQEKAGLAARLKTASERPRVHVDTEHFSAPVMVNEDTNEITPLKLPAGVTHNEKPDAATKYTYGQHTDDNGKVTVTRTGEDGVQKWNGKAWVTLGAGEAIGPKRKDPDAPPAERPLTPGQKLVEQRFNKRQAEQLRKEAAQHQTSAEKFRGLLATPNGASFKDPVTGQMHPMDVSKRTELARSYMDEQQKAKDALQQADEALTGASDDQTAKKSASMAEVGAYAQQKGIPKSQAVREFKAAGYKIGQ